jgi:protein-tyrosine kinase
MSLVEQALKKLQAARGQAPARPVPSPAARPVARPPADPARIVKVNREALRAAGVLPPPQEERRIAQEYRQIKRPLVDNALGRGVKALQNGRLIMLASALPGDGKTFTSVNLALSLALEKDIQTLLIDADVAKPHISSLFGVQAEPGLLDVLRDEALDVESLILPTDVPGLSILPAGRPCETATELLASARMQAVVAQLSAAAANRIALFDSPPLLLTTESRALTGVVGQVVLIVGAGSTPQKAVLDAIDLVGEGRPVSLILNQCDENERSEYYQHYYGTTAETQEAK